MSHGPFASRHWAIGVVVGIVLPAALLVAPAGSGAWILAAALALLGLWIEEDTLVHAGQAQAIS